MSKLPKLIVILGPTASGKTEIAIQLARKFSGEIISADSRSIYKDLNIGTAKPELKKVNGLYTYKNIPHYLVNIVRPDEKFSAAQFKSKAVQKIKEIQKNNKLPFLVGGTGLYIKSVVENYSFPGVAADKKLRQKLKKTQKDKGLEFLWDKLIRLDPKAKKIVDKDNPQRVIRALEVCLKKNKPFSKTRGKKEPEFNSIQIGIKLSKAKLDQKINKRVKNMIKLGLMKEVKELVKKYGYNNTILNNTIGYQEIIPYLKNKTTKKQAIENIKTNTKQFSRRQLTWFKKQRDINWIKTFKQAKKLIKNFLNN